MYPEDKSAKIKTYQLIRANPFNPCHPRAIKRWNRVKTNFTMTTVVLFWSSTGIESQHEYNLTIIAQNI